MTKESITHFSKIRAKMVNKILTGIGHDVRGLASDYSGCHYAPLTCQLNGGSKFFTDLVLSKLPEKSLVIRAGKTDYLNSFLIDSRRQVTLYPASSPDAERLRKIYSERVKKPAYIFKNNLFWLAPQYTRASGWSIAVVASAAPETAVGITVKLKDILFDDHFMPGNAIHLWLDQHNAILPFSVFPGASAKKLQLLLNKVHFRDGWQNIDGFRVLRQKLEATGWQMVTLCPESDIRSTGAILIYTALAALFIALMLWLLIYGQIVVPVRRFIACINPLEPDNRFTRLPTTRYYELNKIGAAYNLLLDKLREQHDELESKIIERTREQTEARQQAEQANKRKNTHLTTISHELRTPLSGALGAIELLQNTEITGEQRSLADTAHQCITSLLPIINNLLDFSRLESGQLALFSEETALLPLLDLAMNTIQIPGKRKGLTLRTFVGASVPLYIHVDGTRLRQILVNLLGNALKFTQAGGIYLSVKRNNDQLIFAISDSGSGIPATVQSEVFQPFFQAQRHIQGTGLGLTIACNLAHMMQGKLELNSTPGLGTCISLHLPLISHHSAPLFNARLSAPFSLHRQLIAWGITCVDEARENALATPELQFLPGKLYRRVTQLVSGECPVNHHEVGAQPWRLNVLLVDDAAINRDIIGMMLKHLGQNVTMVMNASEALSLGRQQRFDIVLMDIHMPGMDGIECARRWRSDPGNQDKDCMIVALSAGTTPEEITQSLNAGMQHYITKPVTMARLAKNLSLAADYQRQRSIYPEKAESSDSTPVISVDDPLIRQKVYQSLHQLLDDVKSNIHVHGNVAALLHKLKGCLGQAGLREMLCKVIELENLVKQGFSLPEEELSELYQLLDKSLG